jgi:hypothetical protein
MINDIVRGGYCFATREKVIKKQQKVGNGAN